MLRIRRLWQAALALIIALAAIAPARIACGAPESDPRHSVLYVQTVVYEDDEPLGGASGTCFFVGEQGKDPEYLLTNQHVISYFEEYGKGKLFTAYVGPDGTVYSYNVSGGTPIEVRAKIEVFFDSNDYEEVALIDSNDNKDIALLRLSKPTDRKVPLVVGKVDDSMVGEQVRVVGYPGLAENEYIAPSSSFGEGDASVTAGAISRLVTLSGKSERAIQTDADIKHGNSGGPMIDKDGFVIGISTWGIPGEDGEEVNYAIDISEAEVMLKRNGIKYHTKEDVSSKIDVVPIAIGVGAAVLVAVIVAVVLTQRKKRQQRERAQSRKEEAATTPKANAPSASGDHRTVSLTSGSAQGARPQQSAPASPQPSPTDSGLRLQFVDGSLSGQRFMIPLGTRLKIGRDRNVCGIAMPPDAPGVSSTHCEVWVDRGVAYVCDLNSSYGTFVEPGVRLNPNNPMAINVGQEVWLGDAQQRFRLESKR